MPLLALKRFFKKLQNIGFSKGAWCPYGDINLKSMWSVPIHAKDSICKYQRLSIDLGWPKHRSTHLGNCFRALMYIAFNLKFHPVIFSASSSMVDATPMCICPCGSTSTRSQSTSFLYHSTSGAIITSSPSDQSSPFYYNIAPNATNTTSASASLGSSICYCPCRTPSSTSFIECKYVCRKRSFHSQN